MRFLCRNAASIAALAMIGCEHDASDDAQAQSLLFTATADTAAVAERGDGTMQITLTDVGAVTAFTDRPSRTASVTSATDFAGRWAEYGFDADPPNAMLIGRDPQGARVQAALTLESFELDTTGSTAVLSTSALHGVPMFYSTNGQSVAAPSLLAEPALFIDDASGDQTYMVSIEVVVTSNAVVRGDIKFTSDHEVDLQATPVFLEGAPVPYLEYFEVIQSGFAFETAVDKDLPATRFIVLCMISGTGPELVGQSVITGEQSATISVMGHASMPLTGSFAVPLQ